MKKELARNIKYILENFEDLNFKPQDLKKLQDTLNFVKAKIQQQIIFLELESNEEVRTELVSALDYLRRRKEELGRAKSEKEEELEFKYPEFEATEIDPTVSTALQEQVEVNRKNKYLREKGKAEKEHKKSIPTIEAEIKEISKRILILEGLESEIEIPDEFIKNFLTQEDMEVEEKKQKLINICAINMGTVIRNPREPIMASIGNKPLFEKKSKGYVYNPEAVNEFLEIARDEELARKLTEYKKARESSFWAKDRLDRAKSRAYCASTRRNELNEQGEFSQEIVQAILNMIKLVRKVEKNYSNMPTIYNSNPLLRFFNRILSQRRENQNDKVFVKFLEKYKEYSSYLLYDEMIDIAESSISVDRDTSIRNERLASKLNELGMKKDDSKEFVKLYTWAKDKSSQDLLSEVDEHLLRVEAQVNNELQLAQSNYDKVKSDERIIFEQFSPRAKEMAERREYIYIDQYIDITYDAYEKTVTPYIASLMLEALVKSDNITNVEDAEKFGLVVTEEEIEEARRKSEQYVPVIAQYAKSVKEKVDSTKDEEAR